MIFKTTEEAEPLSSDEPAREELGLTIAHSPEEKVRGRWLGLGDNLFVVGREVTGAGLAIDDPKMSRCHFNVAFDGRSGAHRIADAKSRNGTYRNGERIHSTLLRAGDVLRAGDTVFVYGPRDAMTPTWTRIEGVAASSLSVLVVGETGSGKERLARALHDRSGRTGQFVGVNCAAIASNLLGSELFGHTRGAFSGAAESRLGLFRAADSGTLFLDEIAEFPFELQAVLLRALQEGNVRPIGSDRDVPVDVRIVAATHSDLEEAMKQGRFRGDLFARLAQVVVSVPPLRERRAEVLPLALELARRGGSTSFAITDDAAEALVRWSWPFNVRELESLVRGFCVSGGASVLDLRYLREHHPRLAHGFRAGSSELPLGSTAASSGAPDRRQLEMLLREHDGNVSAVAKQLGKRRTQVYRWLEAAGLKAGPFR